MTEMNMIRVPQDRLGAIIGPGGATKKLVEEKTSTTLEIDSDNGVVDILSDDPLMAMRAGDFVKAVARGFSPERAIYLFDDEMLMLDILDLSDISSSPKEIKRLKGRIIGRKGRTRSIMERLIGVRISVYGKTVGIIGYPDQIHIIRNAMGMLIDGAPHGPVYSYLERKRKEIRRSQLDAYETITQENDSVEDLSDDDLEEDDLETDIPPVLLTGG